MINHLINHKKNFNY